VKAVVVMFVSVLRYSASVHPAAVTRVLSFYYVYSHM
jgi:hypothetical protein